jgi:hypothetical protein
MPLLDTDHVEMRDLTRNTPPHPNHFPGAGSVERWKFRIGRGKAGTHEPLAPTMSRCGNRLQRLGACKSDMEAALMRNALAKEFDHGGKESKK